MNLPYTYERNYDLTVYKKEVLEKYGLTQANYIYVGFSKEINFRNRCTRWRNHILSNYHISKKVLDFIEKYKKFLENEMELDDKEINEKLFYNYKIKMRHDSEENARKMESDIIAYYQILEALNEYEHDRNKVFVLNDRDSTIKIKDNMVHYKRPLFI